MSSDHRVQADCAPCRLGGVNEVTPGQQLLTVLLPKRNLQLVASWRMASRDRFQQMSVALIVFVQKPSTEMLAKCLPEETRGGKTQVNHVRHNYLVI